MERELWYRRNTLRRFFPDVKYIGKNWLGGGTTVSFRDRTREDGFFSFNSEAEADAFLADAPLSREVFAAYR